MHGARRGREWPKYLRINPPDATLPLDMYRKCQSLVQFMHMAFLTADQRRTLEAVSRLAYCNPFLPERMQLERAVLGGEFEDTGNAHCLTRDRRVS